jgi:hypothetical protein
MKKLFAQLLIICTFLTPVAALVQGQLQGDTRVRGTLWIDAKTVQTERLQRWRTAAGTTLAAINTSGAMILGGETPNTSALLELASTAKGFLPPRMTNTQRDNIGSPATGLSIFNTDSSEHQFWDGNGWETIGSAGGGGLGEPAGSGSELQYRVNSSTFGALTGSSVSGSTANFGGNVTHLGPDPYINVKHPRYGAIGDGTVHTLSEVYGSLGDAQAAYPDVGIADLNDRIDSCAIQQAIHDADNSTWNAVVYVPPGDYVVGKRQQSGSTKNKGAIQPESNTIIRGAGRGITTIRLNTTPYYNGGSYGGGEDIYVFQIYQESNVTIADMTIHGNDSTLTHPGHPEQMHGIHIQESQNVWIQNCEITEAGGDGVRVLGTVGNEVDRVWIRDTHFHDNDRSDIGVQRAVQNIWIVNNYLEGTADQSIDFEPTGTGEPKQFHILGNVILGGSNDFAMTLSGNASTAGHQYSEVRGNVITGRVDGLNINGLKFVGNWLLGSPTQSTQTLRFRRLADNITIQDNYIVGQNGNPGIVIAENNGGFPKNNRIFDNMIVVSGVTQGIYIDKNHRIQIDNNRVIGDNANSTNGIQVTEVTDPEGFTEYEDIQITNNSVEGFTLNGIRVNSTATSRPIRGVLITGNKLKNCVTGIRLDGSTSVIHNVVISNNVNRGGVTTLTSFAAGFNPIMINGTIYGGVGTYLYAGAPEGVVTAPVGSQVVRNDGGNATTLYIKESGTGNTGWRRVTDAALLTSSTFNSTSTTLANVTGLSATLNAGRSYTFRAVLHVTATSATGGHKYAIAGTATATSVVYQVSSLDNGTPGTLRVTSRQTALGGSVSQAGQTSYFTTIEGSITAATAGTLTVQFAQEAASGTSAVLAGSSFLVKEF